MGSAALESGQTIAYLGQLLVNIPRFNPAWASVRQTDALPVLQVVKLFGGPRVDQ